MVGQLLIACTIFCDTASAQCDKKQVLISSKTEYLDQNDVLKKTVDETTRIEINAKSITISPADKTMIGVIKSVSCNWKTAFKEGKTEFKADFEDDGETRPVKIILEGKGGKISFLVILEKEEDKRIRVWADSFEELK